MGRMTDAEMLDWLIKNECAVVEVAQGEWDIYKATEDDEGLLCINAPSPREAIQTAMRDNEGDK